MVQRVIAALSIAGTNSNFVGNNFSTVDDKADMSLTFSQLSQKLPPLPPIPSLPLMRVLILPRKVPKAPITQASAGAGVVGVGNQSRVWTSLSPTISQLSPYLS